MEVLNNYLLPNKCIIKIPDVHVHVDKKKKVHCIMKIQTCTLKKKNDLPVRENSMCRFIET
jgi:hypothetical protein